MMGNLLAQALTIIPPQTAQYYAYFDRTVDDLGILTSTYSDPVEITASIQPVNRSVYELNGLDFNKEYITIFSGTPFLDVNRDVSSDKVVFEGKTFQLMNSMDWNSYDNWNYIMGVRID